MGYRTYEADKYGRITIYPSLTGDRGKSPGLLRRLMKKLLESVGNSGKNGTVNPQVSR